jgi:hypothetical protein
MATADTNKKDGGEETFPIRLVKQETGDVDWNVAKGIYETQVHGETGEPTAEYRLLATIDGVDVAIGSFNAGRIETRVKSLKAAQQSDKA